MNYKDELTNDIGLYLIAFVEKAYVDGINPEDAIIAYLQAVAATALTLNERIEDIRGVLAKKHPRWWGGCTWFGVGVLMNAGPVFSELTVLHEWKNPLATNLFPAKCFRQRRLKHKSVAPDFIQGRDFFFLRRALLLVIRRQRMANPFIYYMYSLYVKRSAHCAQVYPANTG